MFKIVVIGGYAEKYIEKCLTSICTQTEKDWKVQVLLDPVGDKTYEKALPFASDKISIKLNNTRQYGMHNIIDCINLLDPEDEDIIATVDADDWLFLSNSLEIVKNKYLENKNLLITHGSWVGYPNASCPTNNGAYSREDFERGLRKVDWRATHLRTFKYKVWKYVRDADLRNYDGRYYTVSWDIAMMWPMLEMAGYDRILFINEPMYVYNSETPYNDYKVDLRFQMSNERYLASLTPYLYREHF
jgi:glycosyltransferase involved in cell wall biosynthesis